MNIEKAIEILDSHNKWRRSQGGAMQDPKELGQAIDLLLDKAKNHNKLLPTYSYKTDDFQLIIDESGEMKIMAIKSKSRLYIRPW